MAEVILKNVNKTFKGDISVKKPWWKFWQAGSKKGEVKAVADVSINVKDGEFMVLLGPSGCGKTTTLRMIAGLEETTSGEIYIGSKLVNDVSPKDRDIAMVFQNYALYPHMDVYDNMAFGLRLRKVPKDDINKRVEHAAELLHINHLLSRKPRELSGGQRQRVAMGRAIVREPHVFLMDEPLSNLDAKLRVQMRAELQKLHRRLGTTTVYVTHDQTEAMTLGHRIVLMKDGYIQQIDSPLDIYERPKNKFVAGFIGSPSMNFASGYISRKPSGEGLIFKADSFKIDVPQGRQNKLVDYIDKEVIMGIRPEDIYDHMFARGATPGNTLKVMVDVFEAMGSEVYLYVSIGKDILIARVDPHTKAKVNQAMEVVLDIEKIHIFDKETELALTS